MRKLVGIAAVLVAINSSSAQRCQPDEWQCTSSQCIYYTYVCDGYKHCEDGSDEMLPPDECPACQPDMFRCLNGKCVPDTAVCNGNDNCGDGSDEPGVIDKCPACTAEKSRRCGNGHCVPPTQICDGVDNCFDNSDEFDKATGLCPVCPNATVTCPFNGRCIWERSVCDNRNDCGDWSEETPEQCPCEDTEIRCPAVSDQPRGICIPNYMWCDEDGIWDCPDGADEADCDRD